MQGSNHREELDGALPNMPGEVPLPRKEKGVTGTKVGPGGKKSKRGTLPMLIPPPAVGR